MTSAGQVRPTPPKPDTKELILDATEQILVTSGYPRVTTRNIASIAGVKPALIHYHFGSIDLLLTQVLERVLGRASRAVVDILRATDVAPRQRLKNFVAYALQENYESGSAKLWLEVCAMAMNQPDMQDQLRKVITETITLQATQIAPMLREDDYQGALSEHTLAGALTSGLYGAWILRALGLKDATDALLKLVDVVIPLDPS